MRKFIVLTGVIVLSVAAYLLAKSMGPASEPSSEISNQSGAIAKVQVPETLSSDALIGKTAYQAKCADCHGDNAVGRDGKAPPLVHKIYEPSHHGDEAFQRAAAIGVRGHHWPFGDMPPIEGLTRADVVMIVAYIRELQRFNGIY